MAPQCFLPAAYPVSRSAESDGLEDLDCRGSEDWCSVCHTCQGKTEGMELQPSIIWEYSYTILLRYSINYNVTLLISSKLFFFLWWSLKNVYFKTFLENCDSWHSLPLLNLLDTNISITWGELGANVPVTSSGLTVGPTTAGQSSFTYLFCLVYLTAQHIKATSNQYATNAMYTGFQSTAYLSSSLVRQMSEITTKLTFKTI